ncbi:class I SAM-dependent methyltransferase [Sediminibacillus massiliensis]|uniref:class I SAM-dependent methyltransferase n=1 Tax=Sediminibacillus massiliensis TaxID=1926277 RepID=UPI0015C40632|nr:class I SAM-dependent methyltransferase [Sediminibacillus massiliensis]
MGELFDNVADDFNKYRSGYPRKFYQKLINDYDITLKGKKALDMATSNGLAARDIARQGCMVTGIDNSVELIKEAKRTNETDNLPIDYLVGDVTQLPWNEQSFDIVFAVQCWDVLPGVEAALEVFRVLKDDGYFILAQFDQLASESDIVDRTEKLVSQYTENSEKHNRYGMYPEWMEEMYETGFSRVETFTFDQEVTYTHEEWRGRMRTDSEIGGNLPKEFVSAFDKDLDNLLEKYFPDQTLSIPHRMFAVVCQKVRK